MTPRIAIIGAIKDEIAGIKKEMQIADTLRWKTGNAFIGRWQGVEIVLVRSGMGARRARRALAEVAERFELKRVYSIGYAGALDPALKVGDVVAADRVIHAATGDALPLDAGFASDIPGISRGALLTVDEVAATPQAKQFLHEQHGAAAVDMETYALAEEARGRGLHLVSVRAITDTADQELIDCSHLVAEDGDVSKLKAGWHVLTHPGDLKGMIDLGKHAQQATAALTDCMRLGLTDESKPQED